MENPTNPSKGNQTALLVIDVQRGLFKKSSPIYQADQLLENLNLLIRAARQSGTPVIFIQHENEKQLVKGSQAWQLHPRIQPLNDEVIIHKQHGNAFEGTHLQDELQSKEVGKLVITGLVTHGCVRATSFGALELGYDIILVSDGHSNYSKDAARIIEKWNRTLQENGAKLCEAREIDFGNL